MLKNSVTIKDVAKAAGVSTATVSRVLNNDPKVVSETAQKVRDAIEALQYKVNEVARSLKTRATRTIGVIAPELANDFFMELAEGMERELNPHGYTLIVCSSSESVEEEKKRLRLLTERLVDGIVVIPAGRYGRHYRAVQAHGTPVVLVDRLVNGFSSDAVLVDNELGAYEAVSALAADGFHRIGYIGGSLEISNSRERYDGYRRAMHDAGLPLESRFIRFGDMHIESGYRIMREFFEQPDAPSAYFIVNLYEHMGATNFLMTSTDPRREGIVFASFDEMRYMPLLRFCRYAVAQPMGEIGRIAAQMILSRLRGTACGEPETVRMKAPIVRH